MAKSMGKGRFNGDRKAESEYNLLHFKSNTSFGEPVAWSQISPNKLWEAACAVTSAGGALLVGVTQDGGAFSVCVLVNNDKMKEYPHSKKECEDLLDQITDFFTDGQPAA